MKKCFRVEQTTISYFRKILSAAIIIFAFVLIFGIARTIQRLIIRSDIRKQLKD